MIPFRKPIPKAIYATVSGTLPLAIVDEVVGTGVLLVLELLDDFAVVALEDDAATAAAVSGTRPFVVVVVAMVKGCRLACEDDGDVVVATVNGCRSGTEDDVVVAFVDVLEVLVLEVDVDVVLVVKLFEVEVEVEVTALTVNPIGEYATKLHG